MSDRSERFFSWVWRLNGLLLLGLSLAGVAGMLALAFSIGVFAPRERPEEQISEVAGADVGAQGLRLADFRSIAGTRFIYAALAAPSEYLGSSSGGGLGSAHNLLFFDTATMKAHWLLPSNGQTIASFSFLMDPPGSRYGYDDGEAHERNQVAIALLVEVPEQREGEPGPAGLRSLAIAAPDGRSLAPIAESIQGLLGYHHARKDSLLVFYVSSGAVRVLDADPITRTVRSDAPLSTEE